MQKTYVTFGQDHTHRINGTTIDKDCVAVIVSEDAKEGRKIAFELFGPKFSFEYPEKYWNDEKLSYFPRGLVRVN